MVLDLDTRGTGLANPAQIHPPNTMKDTMASPPPGGAATTPLGDTNPARAFCSQAQQGLRSSFTPSCSLRLTPQLRVLPRTPSHTLSVVTAACAAALQPERQTRGIGVLKREGAVLTALGCSPHCLLPIPRQSSRAQLGPFSLSPAFPGPCVMSVVSHV